MSYQHAKRGALVLHHLPYFACTMHIFFTSVHRWRAISWKTCPADVSHLKYCVAGNRAWWLLEIFWTTIWILYCQMWCLASILNSFDAITYILLRSATSIWNVFFSMRNKENNLWLQFDICDMIYFWTLYQQICAFNKWTPRPMKYHKMLKHMFGKYSVTCRGLCVTCFGLDDWIYWHLIHTKLGITGNAVQCSSTHFTVHRYTRTRVLSLLVVSRQCIYNSLTVTSNHAWSLCTT
jgi:hypothetical protein